MRIAALVLLWFSCLGVAAPFPRALPSQAARVAQVGARLAQVVPPQRWSWTFVIVDDRLPLAYAPREGVVVVSVGLLDLELSGDELAGVLAHEMAHRIKGHMIRERVPQSSLRQLEEESARLREGVSGRRQLEQEARQLVEQRNLLASYVEADRRSNHACELQADALGREYASAAGYSRDGLENALRKLLLGCDTALTGESITHPALSQRIEILHSCQGSTLTFQSNE